MYQGKLIDAMAQIDYDIDHQEFISYLDDSGIDKVMLFGRKKNRGNSLVYAEELSRRYPSRVNLGSSKKFDQRIDLENKYVDHIINGVKKGKFKFIGELMLTHADKFDGEENPTLERYVDSSSANVFQLLENLVETPVPVQIHWEVYHWDRDYQNISNMLNSFPGLNFIWPHCGFANYSQVETMISSHSNLYVTLSKRELKRYKELWISYDDDDLGGFAMVNPDFTSKVDGAIVNSDGKLFPEWKQLLETYPDRFMFATDCHKLLRWKAYKKIVDRWRNILGQLEESTARCIAYENSQRIYKLL